MKLANVQSEVAARITAVPALNVFGTPIQYSLFADDESARTAIATAIRTTGVCIEIGLPSAHRGSENPPPRATVLDAMFDVFVAESPKVAHSPTNLALVDSVVAAIRTRAFPQEQVPELTDYAAAKAEAGYILHALSFTVPVTVP